MNGRLKNWLGGRALLFLLDLVLIAALAVSLAYWTWVFAAPRALASPLIRVQVDRGARDAPALRRLFGAPGPATASRPASSANLRLVGIVAPDRGAKGRAIFALEGGKPRTARPGDAVVPGLVLREIFPNHVVVEREGSAERMTLERKAAAIPEQEPRTGRNGGG